MRDNKQGQGRGRLGSGGSFSSGSIDLSYTSINGAQAVSASDESKQAR